MTDFRSGALKRLMMLDLQRIEDEKLLLLPRLNPVAMILDVLSDRELPQVRSHFTFAVFAVFSRSRVRSCCARATAASWSWAMTGGSARA